MVLDDVSAGLETVRRLWRDSGLDTGNLARCILDATPEAADLRLPQPPILRAQDPPSGYLLHDRYATYLAVKARLELTKDGTVAAPAIWLDQEFSSEGARSRWPALAPVISTCFQQTLASVRLEPGRPVDSSTVTLSVHVSKTEESWDLPDWLSPGSQSRPIPGAVRPVWIGGGLVLLGGILIALVAARRRLRARRDD